ncbi:MxcI [Myxococcus sp. CA040A]|uniref:MxcI n=1 Tax=Myxococcus sp. CA040A TaxID=2741738 RepID=UPI00157B5336|nr:MxcI [Myxococcus sp. CA040A]NTX01702.1 MxcI [Myxococcus sp. CA040A]
MHRGALRIGKGGFSKGLVACAALFLSACGDDEPTLPGGPGGGEEGALYLVHSAVETNGSRMNYFTLVDSLDEPKTLDYSKSLELPGRPRLYAAKGVGFFAIGAGESPTITRYEVKDGALTPGASISFQNLGVKRMGAQAVHFVSATKAYYKDDAQGQIIVWNPAEMAVEKTLALPAEFTKAGYVTGLSQWATREGEAFFAVGWSTSTYDTVLPGSVLVRIDTATDALSWSSDERCRDLTKTGRQGDTLYFFSGVINGLGYAVKGAQDAGQQDCFLRIPAGQQTFDTGFVGSVASALGENNVGTIIALTENGTAWLQVADTTITPSAPGTTYSEWYSKGWSWWQVPLATLSAPSRVDAAPGAYSGFTLTSGSSFFVSQSAATYSTSTLMELSSGAPKPSISFPGFVLDVARIR